MERITIEVQNQDDIKKILKVVEKMKVKIKRSNISRKVKKSPLIHLKKIAESGGMKDLIKDPVIWQRESRQDRKLPI